MATQLPKSLAKGGIWRRKALGSLAQVSAWPVAGSLITRLFTAWGKLKRYRMQHDRSAGVLVVPGVLLAALIRPLWELVWTVIHGILALVRRIPVLGRPLVLLEMHRIKNSGIFDPVFYLMRHPDAAAGGLTPVEHFVRRGAALQWRPHALFETGFYVEHRPWLRWLSINPVLHYLGFGRGDELDPSPIFDASYYLDQNRDAAASRRTPLEHYLAGGWRSRRSAHPLFDADYYCRRYAWADRPDIDPLAHYVTHGAREGSDPHPVFDTRYYLRLNNDVWEAGGNPLVHYLWRGAAQGRDPSPMFDTGFYLRQYPDVAAKRMNPLVHFALYGASQGRLPSRPTPPPWDPRSRDRSRLRLRPGRPKAVFVLPDGNDTPLSRLVLDLVAYFDRERLLDCVVVLEVDGPLHGTFERHGLVLVEEHFTAGFGDKRGALERIDTSDVRFGLVASARCAVFLRALAARNVPPIALIVEQLDREPRALAEIVAKYAKRIVFPSEALLEAGRRATPISEEQGRVVPFAPTRSTSRGLQRNALRRELTGDPALAEDTLIVLGIGARGDEDAAPDFDRITGRIVEESQQGLVRVWLRDAEPGADPDPEGLRSVPEPADLSSCFLAADVVVSTATREGYPSKVLQALANGRPVVTYAAPGDSRAVAGDGAGRRTLVGDVAGASAALRAVLADREALAAQGRMGPRLVRERFGAQATYAALDKLIEEDLGIALPKRAGSGDPAVPVKPRVIFAAPAWSISGVNTFTETVMAGLLRRGFEVELLFTGLREQKEFLPSVPYRFLDEVLPGTGGPWSTDRWKRVIQYLVQASPCIFVPGFDYFASAVCPTLPDEVGCLGIVHSDDFEHYEHTERLGRYWNALVGVSECCYERMLEACPQLRPVAHHIPYGIVLPEARSRAPRDPKTPLRIVYTGRIEQVQKNILAIPLLVRELDAIGLSYVLTLVGDGSMDAPLRQKLEAPISAGRVRLAGRMTQAEVQAELKESDVFLLVSFFEGLPVALLEGMAWGCVPVVSDIDSGVPELVLEGVTGHRVPVHDLAAFAQRLKRLADDPALLAAMSKASMEHVHARYGDERMSDEYAAVMHEIWREITQSVYHRATPPRPPSELGPILLPPWLQRDPATFP